MIAALFCQARVPAAHCTFKDPMSKPTVDPTSNAKTGPAVPVNFLRPIIQADLDLSLIHI